ncbi:MAG: GNAT family N-acetyltransferase [Candidatus Hodarchaeota archaeon]
MPIEIRKALSADLDDTTRFIERLQANESHNICYLPLQKDEIQFYLHEEGPCWPNNVLLAYKGKKLIGFIRIITDAELGRAWIEGPLVDNADWHSIADKLYTIAIENLLSDGINDYELCGDVANQRLSSFALHQGFSQNPYRTIHISYKRNKLINLPVTLNVSELTPKFQKAFIKLHDTIFPNTYYSGKQIVKMLNDKKKVFIVDENEFLRGYIYIILDESTNKGYIDFLGVAKSARRQGIGTRLVIAGIQWLYANFDINKITLCVNEKDIGVYDLYKKIGFEPLRWIQGYQKRLNSNEK